MNPSLKLAQALWISDPADLLHIDFTDPHSIEKNTTLTDPALDMSTIGWRRVGAVTLEYVIDKTPEQMAQAAVEATQQAIQKLQADTEVKLNALRETESKLQSLSWNGQSAADVTVVSDAVYSNDKQPAEVFIPLAEDWLDIIQSEEWKCVKTGCQLILQGHRTEVDSYWGDLFYRKFDGTYLFNCANASPAKSRHAGEPHSMHIEADVDAEGFTTSYRGFARLLTFSAQAARRSVALQDHMAKWEGF